MDFSDIYTMMGLCSKESTKMDSEMDGEDLSLQMEMSLKKITITENQSLIYILKFNSIFYNISINHLYIFS